MDGVPSGEVLEDARWLPPESIGMLREYYRLSTRRLPGEGVKGKGQGRKGSPREDFTRTCEGGELRTEKLTGDGRRDGAQVEKDGADVAQKCVRCDMQASQMEICGSGYDQARGYLIEPLSCDEEQRGISNWRESGAGVGVGPGHQRAHAAGVDLDRSAWVWGRLAASALFSGAAIVYWSGCTLGLEVLSPIGGIFAGPMLAWGAARLGGDGGALPVASTGS